MTKQFAGKSALITGGGSGIGRASALALAAEGALVTVTGRTEETLKETVRVIEADGGSARSVVADMTDEAQVEKAVAAATENGHLDLALNNAGYDGEYQLTTDYSTEMLDHMIALNVRGVFLSMSTSSAGWSRRDRARSSTCRPAPGCSASPGSPAIPPPKPPRSR